MFLIALKKEMYPLNKRKLNIKMAMKLSDQLKYSIKKCNQPKSEQTKALDSHLHPEFLLVLPIHYKHLLTNGTNCYEN